MFRDRSRPSFRFAPDAVVRRALRCVLACLAFATGSANAATASGFCTPAGGAPGAAAQTGSPIGGAIGPGVGGRGVDAFVAQLAGGNAPAPSGCAAPLPAGDAATGGSASGEPASIPAGDADRAAGNPVDVVTGNKYQRQVDVAFPHPESSALSPDGLAAAFGLPKDDSLLLLFARHYNSRNDYALSLGRGWSHSFDTRLARIVRGRRVELQIVQADGRRLAFTPLPGAKAPRTYGSGRIADGLVDEDFADANAAFVWRWPGGRRLVFDADGRLAQVVAPNLDSIGLRRDDAGRVLEIGDSSGRRIALDYAGTRLAALRLPDGQRIAYDYDAHGQLAGVRYPDGRTQRYHYEDPRAFHLLTGITDTDGRRSRYAYDDAFRVSRSQGLGQADAQALSFAYVVPRRAGQRGSTIVESGGRVSRYRWLADARSGPRLVESDGDGCERCPPMGLRATADRHGRTVAIGALRIRHDASGRIVERRVDGRGGAPSRSERLHYSDADPLSPPVRIERSSVVAGRTLRIDIGYGPRSQIASIDVSGFAPAGKAPEPVHASLRLQYAPAGPAAGRLVSIAREGRKDEVVRTVFVHDSQRRLVRIGHAAVLVHSIERDALGRPVAERFPDGTRRTRNFDRAWRLAATSARGAGLRFDYDAAGRPRQVEWSDGRRWTIHLRPGAVEIESNHGWRRSFGTQPAGRIARAAMPVAMLHATAGRQVVVDASGRRTELLRDDLGRLVEARSSHAGSRRQRYDALGRLARVELGDGSVDLREHDLAGRILRREQRKGDERIETRFGYEQGRLVRIDHPAQRSLARHDALGRLVELTHERDGHAYRQSFEYDPRGRLSAQRLPDGSRLDFGYDALGRSTSLGLSMHGAQQTRWLAQRLELRHPPGVALQLGNGVRFERRDDASGRPLSMAWEGPPGSSPAVLAFRRLRWHPDGLPLAIAHGDGEDRYGYDRFGRVIVRERHDAPAAAGGSAPRHAEYFAYEATGGPVAARRRDGRDWRAGDGGRASDGGRDAAGRPTHHGAVALRYGAQQRIVEARAGEGATRYRYDALGERVAKDGPAGRRGFLYHRHALAAETDAEGRVVRQYLRWNGRLVAVLDHAPASAGEGHGAGRASLAWIHADHLGTPVAATDEDGRVVWRGDWDVYGRLARAQGSFAQPLRFAGQYFDPETGLHDNLSRSYDPDSGRYLEPDPLGLAGGFDPYAYADGNPLAATDPLGLILFAFDGTGNDADGADGEDITNVRKFFDQYDEPGKWYMAGVGSDDAGSGIRGGLLDAADAGSARARVDWMLGTLDGHLGDAWIGRSVPIDVIGFSRGAAMARDFVNRVSTLIDERHFWARGICVDLRFLGLWDTVAQFGVAGSGNASWQLAIPSSVRATFHAVALNEHRALFPLESALGGSAWVVERGFVGSHADVGGGNAEGDLSDVSLAWMAKMAQGLGVPLRARHPRDRTVTDPRVHDRNYSGLGDRDVVQRDASGTVVQRTPQRLAAIPGMSWHDAAAFLVPYPRRGIDATGQPSLVGEVDMSAYAAWLKASYGVDIGH